MRGFMAEPAATYGGPWTLEKLQILGAYLDAYTTALKNRPFRLVYIDAFAGTGSLELPEQDPYGMSFTERLHKGTCSALSSTKEIEAWMDCLKSTKPNSPVCSEIGS